MAFELEDPYLNSALSEVALTLKNSLLSSGNVDVFLPIVTSPRFAPTIPDVTNFLTKSFPKVVSVDKTPHFIVALDPSLVRVDARIASSLECNSPGSSFLALVTILHGVAHATRHEFVPAAIRGSCVVNDKDEWLNDPGYEVEHALFGGIIGVAFAGSPTDPILPEISYFTLFTEDGYLYKIDLEKATSWIENDELGPFDLEQLPKEDVATEEVHLQTCARVNTLCANVTGKFAFRSSEQRRRPPGPHWIFPRQRDRY
ncbi:uncharacterized protein EV420DRAFT_1521557 [Desarmillaria tabescens]|uniref:Uncharacterized protein n=1 Tax=Armillaria tabescens TaxID=1929756 RepID=A0AA39NC56_ARMTA|nr:uncharacterized protein EV420DRAFT_1521557 [Desarmillaria tabescens]KAK0462905.1 hypothetical protein EV420DRAFT_1521557 [Desarmillaria tabescens]